MSLLFKLQVPLDLLFLLVGEPFRIRRFVIQPYESHHAQDHRWQAFEQEHPLPALESHVPGKEAHDPAGQGGTDQPGDRHTDEKQRGNAPASAGGIPVGEVQNDPREEPGFCHAQQHAQSVELPRRLHEHGQCRHQPPQQHDSQQRLARTDAGQQQIARHFEQQEPDEKQAGAQPEHRCAETQVVAELQLGNANVDPVYVIDDVAQQQQRHDPPADAPINRRVVARGRGRLHGNSCLVFVR
ncbi:hypothetical protein D3C85_974110 [compost metagenome]